MTIKKVLIGFFSFIYFTMLQLYAEEGVIPSANFQLSQFQRKNLTQLAFNLKLPDTATKVAIVFSPSSQVFLQKNKDKWTGNVAVSAEIKKLSAAQLFIRLGRLRFYSAYFPFKYVQDQKAELNFIVKIDEKERKLAILLSPESDQTFTTLFDKKLLAAQIIQRNQAFGIKDKAAIAAEARRKAELDAKKKSFFGSFLKPTFIEKHNHQFETELFSITPIANKDKSINAYKEGTKVSDVWDWRVQGRTSLFNMHYWNVIKMSTSTLPDIGENNTSIKKVYSRFRGDNIFIQLGDLSQRYSSQSLAGNFIGADAELNLLWGISFHTMLAYGGDPKWDWLNDPVRSTKYRQNVTSFRLKKDFGRLGYIGISQAQGKDDLSTLVTTTNVTAVDTQITGLDFSFKRLLNKTLDISGEYFASNTNPDLSGTGNYETASAYNLKTTYTTPKKDHQLIFYYGQVDPSYRSIGRAINYDRNEIWLRYKTRLLDKKMQINARYKTYHDNTKNNLDKTTTYTNPSITAQYKPFKNMKYFRLTGIWNQTSKKAESNTDPVDYTAQKTGISLNDKWEIIEYSLIYNIQNKNNKVATSDPKEDHNIMKAVLKTRYDNLGPLSFLARFSYSNDDEKKDSGNTKESILDYKVNTVLDLWGAADIGLNYGTKTRTRTVEGREITTTLGIPFTFELDSNKNRKLEIIYQKDIHTFEQADEDYNEQSILLKVVWEL